MYKYINHTNTEGWVPRTSLDPTHSTRAAALSTHSTHCAAHRPLHTQLSVTVASAAGDRRLRAASASQLAALFCSRSAVAASSAGSAAAHTHHSTHI